MNLYGTLSNVTQSAIDSQFSGSVDAYTSISLNQRSNAAVTSGIYEASVYAYVSSGSDVIARHVDTFILGNLADTP